MFKTKRLTLRGYRPSDEDFFLGLFDNYNILSNVNDGYTWPNVEEHRKILENMTKSSLFLAVEHTETSEVMGMVLMGITTPKNLDGELGLALAEKWWGQGYGTEIIEWLLRHSFRSLGLRRVSLFVYASNERAVGLYTKVGFKVEGRKRQAIWKEGKWVDIIWMGILSSEYYPPR